MTKITNIDELMAEKRRLKESLHLQRDIIQEEIQLIKDKFTPIVRFLKLVGVIKDENDTRSTLLKVGTYAGIDIIGQKILSRANWITRFVVPVIAKGLSSTFFSRFRRKQD